MYKHFLSVFLLGLCTEFPNAVAEFVPIEESPSGMESAGNSAAEKDPQGNPSEASVKELPSLTEEERAAQIAAAAARQEALRKCGQKYDYAMKRKTLDLRKAQAEQKKRRIYENSEYLVAKNPALAKERRAEIDKELEDLGKEQIQIEDSCLGQGSTKGNLKDSSPIKK